ncbi:glycosyl hydrolase family 43 protein [Truncatella angustata]|uniref:Glycosyl hydrolase family 43 protein n=1 Tax=Truncatella angustata TaxID=152316 RepID=A0A9P8UU67_9PEZI|nr:glycosyl hydrolase family 43 protein [Truncatella angustata]KAH6658147.1 glycosyl hydrolase family 43 protein [Truncatella angustata]
MIFYVTVALAISNFTNPVVYADFADNDVFKGPDSAYYFSASSFQFSPGAPILKSFDLVNWELIGHSVPSLAGFGPKFEMNGTPPYVSGVWASTMRYRGSTGMWHWYGCIGFSKSFIYTAASVTGPWTQAGTINTCFYDCGLLIDDDDKMYIVYGQTNISIATLASDGLSISTSAQVFTGPDGHTEEGSRLYKINDYYYVLGDRPNGTTYVWRSSSIYGNWTYQTLQTGVSSPISGGGLIDQGSFIQGPDRNWYFMSCTWSYPAGRIPILAPITWNNDWPTLAVPGNNWAVSYPFPSTSAAPQVAWTGTDVFSGTSLREAWEWNFAPDITNFTINNGLTLRTATVTNDLYKARNTLTQRTYGPYPVGTAKIDFSGMVDGDSCGLAAFRDSSAWIGIMRSGTSYNLVQVSDATQNATNKWSTISNGTISARKSISAGSIYIRVSMDVRPNGAKSAKFSYSSDGSNFTTFGLTFTLNTTYNYFTGYRYGIFNFATKSLGGFIKVISFTSS